MGCARRRCAVPPRCPQARRGRTRRSWQRRARRAAAPRGAALRRARGCRGAAAPGRGSARAAAPRRASLFGPPRGVARKRVVGGAFASICIYAPLGKARAPPACLPARRCQRPSARAGDRGTRTSISGDGHAGGHGGDGEGKGKACQGRCASRWSSGARPAPRGGMPRDRCHWGGACCPHATRELDGVVQRREACSAGPDARDRVLGCRP